MGIKINGINQTNVILISICIAYSVLSRFPLPNVLPVLLSSNLAQMPKHRCFFIRVLRSNLFKWHSSSNSYHLKTEWITYQRKLSHKSTGWILTVNQYLSQQSSWPFNRPAVHHSHSLCIIINLLCCSVFLGCEKLEHENPIISSKKNQWYESNRNSNIFKISKLTLELV